MIDPVVLLFGFAVTCTSFISTLACHTLWLKSLELRRRNDWRSGLDAFILMSMAVTAGFVTICVVLTLTGLMIAIFAT